MLEQFDRASDCCLMPAQQFFQLYHGDEKFEGAKQVIRSCILKDRQ
jgi:hypothetical protein